jgi:hypothetical protein
MTEIERLEVISGFIAQPEFVGEFRIGAPNVSKGIDSHNNPTSFNRFSVFSPTVNMTSYLEYKTASKSVHK